MAIDYQEPHRREGLIGTLVVHGVLLLIFVFTVFKGPNPPLEMLNAGGSGDVELNYGLDPAGSGDVQSTAPANDSRNREDSRPPQASPDPQPRPQVTATPDPTPPTQEKIITSEAEESPVSAPAVETPAPPKEEVKAAPKVPRKVAVTFAPKGSNTGGGGNGVNGTSNAPTGNNNGDKPGTVGDQGDPNGSLDAKALYGNGGDGNGGGGRGRGSGNGIGDGLDMAGWRVDSNLRVESVDNNSGVIRFKIKISADGDVESVTKVSGNVTPAQEKLCRDKLLSADFVKTNTAQGGATGFYTYRFSVR